MKMWIKLVGYIVFGTISCGVLIGIMKLLNHFGISSIESGLAILITAVLFSIDRLGGAQEGIATRIDLKLQAILQHLDREEDTDL